MSEIFDKLLTSRPVNRAAARVLGGGVHYEPDKEIVQRHWTAPPPLKTIPPAARIDPKFVDLTGVSFGRFRVIGYLGVLSEAKKAKALWLVRCACGDYESRSAKSVQNPENHGDRCEKCRHLAFLKRREQFLRNPTAPQADVRDI
jgi:hypothetical protein